MPFCLHLLVTNNRSPVFGAKYPPLEAPGSEYEQFFLLAIAHSASPLHLFFSRISIYLHQLMCRLCICRSSVLGSKAGATKPKVKRTTFDEYNRDTLGTNLSRPTAHSVQSNQGNGQICKRYTAMARDGCHGDILRTA